MLHFDEEQDPDPHQNERSDPDPPSPLSPRFYGTGTYVVVKVKKDEM